MAHMPKRVKHRKVQRGRIKRNATRGNKVSYGDYGLQALEAGRIPAQTIEAARITGNRTLAGEGRIFIRMFPHMPITRIPQETRMGKGKGEPDKWCAVVQPGRVLFEIGGASPAAAKKAMCRIAHKLPVKVRLIERRPM
ncbi:MAG: 50S ribosomal protein L16 [Planctomycetes bacterium]|nr:50S ribosomal protein L16 [Planctomycetota bacterium]